jgi:hypothetical protein
MCTHVHINLKKTLTIPHTQNGGQAICSSLFKKNQKLYLEVSKNLEKS